MKLKVRINDCEAMANYNIFDIIINANYLNRELLIYK